MTGTTPDTPSATWLRAYKEQVFLFTRVFTVSWTNNVLRARRESRETPPGRLRLLA